ncbi:hypothetical protein [Brevundimonas goettingensis]|uniref:Uncharacterized protein n=1 Tax=Brevundimonas goettingensis TaxID=2774190 RepID=A0A975C272_9CAUL|nr:hypothetical protein [Brevundimonas goettingensis]QTC91099.1 hypothetical protein IFJ75_18135 [Brevundimonas goettingensis]
MAGKQETAPVRGVVFGLLTIVVGYAGWAVHTAGRIHMTSGKGPTRAEFAISRLQDGWQFDLTVLLMALVALACLAGFASAAWDLFSSERQGV